MNKEILVAIICMLIAMSVFGQAPEKMSYQAVVRNANGDLIKDQFIGMQISVLQGGASGIAVYVETQTPKSNVNGLVKIQIGEAAIVSGVFADIDWGSDEFYIKTEIDPLGSTDYTVIGVSQMMSVPYALHAKTATNILNDKVDDADADITNELQALSISNDTILIVMIL